MSLWRAPQSPVLPLISLPTVPDDVNGMGRSSAPAPARALSPCGLAVAARSRKRPGSPVGLLPPVPACVKALVGQTGTEKTRRNMRSIIRSLLADAPPPRHIVRMTTPMRLIVLLLRIACFPLPDVPVNRGCLAQTYQPPGSPLTASHSGLVRIHDAKFGNLYSLGVYSVPCLRSQSHRPGKLAYAEWNWNGPLTAAANRSRPPVGTFAYHQNMYGAATDSRTSLLIPRRIFDPDHWAISFSAPAAHVRRPHFQTS